MINWLFNAWYARLRKIDIKILWPTCREQASSIGEARTIFAIHAFHDKSWLILGDDEIIRQIDRLE
jgi:hypothetical protein